MTCPIKNESSTVELTVHTSCYWGLRLTLCYNGDYSVYIPSSSLIVSTDLQFLKKL